MKNNLKFIVPSILLLSLGATLLWAQNPPRSPWQWSLEDRLTLRFDPAHQEQRRQSAGVDNQSDLNIVQGSRNPELLLPVELFRSLIRNGMTLPQESREVWRAVYEKAAKDGGGGVPADVWKVLQVVAADILDIQHKLQSVQEQLERAGPVDRSVLIQRSRDLQKPLCPLYFEALAAAREIYGQEVFDRFLYEAVAPGHSFKSRSSRSPAPRSKQALLKRATGCPS